MLRLLFKLAVIYVIVFWFALPYVKGLLAVLTARFFWWMFPDTIALIQACTW